MLLIFTYLRNPTQKTPQKNTRRIRARAYHIIQQVQRL